MIKLHNAPVMLRGGRPVPADETATRYATIADRILRIHSTSKEAGRLSIRFDSLVSHDITYVGIIQTAKASGMTHFPVPYALTNCHNSLCAVGGTINEDDHIFGLSAAKKYGGIYVPANQAVIHQFAREMMAGCGKMILGSDSHTRYGALGTMGFGEGGPELVRQLLQNTYDIAEPEIVLVWLTGTPAQGVGPHDVALALCGAVYKNSFVKNKVLEFSGPGIRNLPMDYRIGIDVMTTETACLSSIWETNDLVEAYLAVHGRADEYRRLTPGDGARYDAMIEIDLGTIEPMAALPFHPSEAVPIRELLDNPGDILRETEKRAEAQFGGKARLKLTDKVVDGRLMLDQGVIAGCAGGMYDNIAEAAAILRGHDIGSGYFSLSVYPPSVPVNLELMRSGVAQELMEAGVLMKSCFCGPCFGAGDVPGNNALSARHTTRNFPNREGSRPVDGQLSGVILMDARSIAATARNHGALTSATDVDYEQPMQAQRHFDRRVYDRRVYFGFGKADPDASLRYGPNITEWPEIPELPENLLLRFAAVLHDDVTTTDELIPSGETSSYRSNPIKLAQFALSRRVPEYVGRAEAIQALEKKRADGTWNKDIADALRTAELSEDVLGDTQIGSIIFACRPGDGSAREQAASCQRVLGGAANLCYAFATKRYRSNCINWGMLPLTTGEEFDLEPGDWLWLPNVRSRIAAGDDDLPAKLIGKNGVTERVLHLNGLTEDERQILLDGCLMNFYKAKTKGRDQ